jgi:hypothetical protein
MNTGQQPACAGHALILIALRWRDIAVSPIRPIFLKGGGKPRHMTGDGSATCWQAVRKPVADPGSFLYQTKVRQAATAQSRMHP